MADRESGAQVWGAAVVVSSALAVVAAYLINGAALVLVVAGVEVLLLMVYVGRRWRLLRQVSEPDRRAAPRSHRTAGGTVDAAHCERCRRAREAIDARQAGRQPRTPHAHDRHDHYDRSRERRREGGSHEHGSHERGPHERPVREWTAERAAVRSHDRSTARHGAPGSAGRAVGHQ
ncbi:hypothetical protein OHV13_18910 [Kitasatospora purpeofusca]|uniref:Uncharacterized protein n=1 Tax=Kitasatospora purpeofusca TaxID=67352 RepID=A0ABZ1U109_9ACTN|nr:hypothetical protein [Kitasatospora purpeofusca]